MSLKSYLHKLDAESFESMLLFNFLFLKLSLFSKLNDFFLFDKFIDVLHIIPIILLEE